MKSLLTFILILCYGISSGQTKIRDITYSIIDTSSSKYEQSRQIYNWVTRHIAYDLKSYLNNSIPLQTSAETLKKRTGLCFDFALLFKEMCESAGIECCLVFGYCKGIDFENGDQFFRANHCWNVVHIGPKWINVDPTWGSGSIEQKPDLYESVKHLLFKKPKVDQKYVFVKKLNPSFFDFGYNNPSPTHLPLDPKWQLMANPIGIAEFESDSFTVRPRPTYQNIYELEMVKGLSWEKQHFIEGINGKKFNPQNFYDAAQGFLNENSGFNYKNWTVNRENLDDTKLMIQNYAESYQNIIVFNQQVDSFLNLKVKKLNTTFKIGQNLKLHIKETSKRSRKRIGKKLESIFKKENSLYRRLGTYELKIESIRKKNLNEIEKLKHRPKLLYYEAYQYAKVSKSMNKVDLKCDSLTNVLNGLIQQSKELLDKDFLLTNHIYNTLDTFHLNLKKLKTVIQSKNTPKIIRQALLLDSTYTKLRNLTAEKRKNIGDYNKVGNSCLVLIREIVSHLELGLDLTRNYFRATSNDSSAYQLFGKLKLIIESKYNTASELTRLSLAVNSIQVDYQLNFNKQISSINKTAKVNLSFLGNFLEFALSKQKRILERETALGNQIESISKPGMNQLKTKIERFNKVNYQ